MAGGALPHRGAVALTRVCGGAAGRQARTDRVCADVRRPAQLQFASARARRRRGVYSRRSLCRAAAGAGKSSRRGLSARGAGFSGGERGLIGGVPRPHACIPDRYEHLVRYAGWYSNRAQGERAKKSCPSAAVALTSSDEQMAIEFAARARATWARLIRKVSRASSRRVTTLGPHPRPLSRVAGEGSLVMQTDCHPFA